MYTIATRHKNTKWKYDARCRSMLPDTEISRIYTVYVGGGKCTYDSGVVVEPTTKYQRK